MSLLARSLATELVIAPDASARPASRCARHRAAVLPDAVVRQRVQRRARPGAQRQPVLRRGPSRSEPARTRRRLRRVWLVGDEAHVTNVAVHPEHRRRGIAVGLLAHLADRAIESGAQSWTLEVRTSSTGAQELYRRFGFAPAGIRRRYYDNVEDAIVMWCHDIAGPEYAARLTELRAAGRGRNQMSVHGGTR